MQKIPSWSKAVMFATILMITFFVIPAITSPDAPGPQMDLATVRVIKSPDAQVKEMKLGNIDFYPGLIRPGDVEELSDAGFKIRSTGGNHFCYIATNIRAWDWDEDGVLEAGWPAPWDCFGYNWTHPTEGWAYDVNEGESKRFLLDNAYRHAVAHLIPKDIIIGTIFKYIVVRQDTVVPPALGRYFNPDTPKHDFDPAHAVDILLAAGYTTDGSKWYYPAGEGGGAFGPISIVSPTYEEAPTSYTIAKMTVEAMNDIGLTNVSHEPQIYPMPLVWNTLYIHQFDMYFLCWGNMGADSLWGFFHSDNDRFQGFNTPGVNSTEIDALTLTLRTSLDLAEVIAASKEIQYKLMDPANDYALCYAPIYSRNYFDSYSSDLGGIIDMLGTGSDNSWTWRHLKWKGVTGGEFKYVIGTEPFSFNQLSSRASDEIAIWATVFDSGIISDPYSTDDMAALATDWSIEKYPDPDTGPGMRLNYTLRSGVKWHDGTYFSASDAKFCYDYMYEFQPGVWIDIWRFYDHCDVVDAGGATGGGKISVYTTTTGLFVVYDYAGVMDLLPPQVWTHVGGTEEGTPLEKDNTILIYNDLYDGAPVAFDPWRTDDPSATQIERPYAPGTYFTLSCLFGTADWIFETYNEPDMYAKLVANRNWWRTIDGVHATLQDMFHWSGDVNLDEKTDGADLSLQGLAWGTSVPIPDNRDLAPRHETRADIHPVDGFIDIEDLYVTAANMGDKLEY